MKYGHYSCAVSVVVEFTGRDSESDRARNRPDSGFGDLDRRRDFERHRGAGLFWCAAGDLRIFADDSRAILGKRQ